MDNCMFQIETALLKFDDMSESLDKTSVVKRYISVFNKYLKLMVYKKQSLLREDSSTPDRC